MDMATAVNQIKKLGLQYEAVIELGKFVEDIARLENFDKELSRSIEQKQGLLKAIETRLEQCEAKITDVESLACKMSKDANNQLEAAKNKAREIVDVARSEAAVLVGNADKQAKEIVAAATVARSALESEISQKQAEYEALSEQHEAVKEKIRSFVA